MNTNRKILAAVQMLVALSLVLSFFPSAPAVAAGPGGCQEIRSWVRAHEGALPRDYEGISQFPLAYRRVIFGVLTPEEKSEVWRAHLEAYLATHADLTATQLDLLREAVDFVSSDLFATSRQDKRWAREVQPALAEFARRAKEAFGPAQAREIFEQIGPPELDLFTSKLASGIACACSRQSDYCPDGYGCANNVGCDAGGHCGTFLVYTCDGLCKDANANILINSQ